MPAAIAAFIGPAIGVTSATGLSILSSVIGIGLSIGGQLLAQALFGPKQPKPEDMQGVIRQSVAARSRHYGRRRVGGNVVFIETKNGTLFMLVVHGEGPIHAFTGTYIDNRLVTLDAGDHGGVTTYPYSADKQIIYSQAGLAGVSGWTHLESDFSDIWTSDHKLEGLVATLIYAASVDQDKVAETYPNRIPVINRVIEGAIVYDPRTATMVWTQNAALIMRDYLTHSDGMKIPASLIDDTLFSAAANVCDESVTIKAGGTILRYAIGLSYSFEDEPRDIVNRIIAACDGRLFITSEGKIGFSAGKWVAPTVTITDAHVISYELTDGSGPFRESNEIIVKYSHVEVGYKEATSDPWRDEDSISLLGEVRSNTLTAYEIEHHNHARRIAKIVQRRSAPRWQGTIVTLLHGLNCWDQRWITLQLADLDIDGTFEIIGTPAINTRDMTVTLQVQSFDADTYDFDPATEEGTAPTVPDDTTADTGIEEPQNVVTGSSLRTVGEVTTVDTIYDPGSGSNSELESQSDIQVYVATISWDAASRDGLQAEAQYSLNGTDWFALAVATSGLSAETSAVARGSTVRLRVRWKATGGGTSDWVDGTDVVIPA
jgi:hypothetical protein